MSDAPSSLAVVTGASSGIGRATALALGAQGYRVVLVARNEERLNELKAEIDAGPGEGIVSALDASDGAAVKTLASWVRESHGVPQVIVNSAGAGRWLFAEETEPDEAVEMMGAPYFAAFNVSSAFMADLLRARRGVIVHVGSPASIMPWPGATAYTAARWALRGLHEALVQDLRGTGVHSCHVVFGEVSSEYFKNNPDSHQYLPGIGKLIPVTSPEECARVIERVIARPRRQRLHPFMLRLFNALHWLAPGWVRHLAASTGRQHQSP